MKIIIFYIFIIYSSYIKSGLPQIIPEDDSCLSYDESNNCINCKFGYYLNKTLNECLKCSDPNCIFCSTDKNCFKCKSSFLLANNLCGISCENAIENCKICTENYEKCLKCNGNCFWDKNYCNCFYRNLLMTFLFILIIFIILVLIYCFINPNFSKYFYSFDLLNIINGNYSKLYYDEDDNVLNENKKIKANDYKKINQISINENIIDFDDNKIKIK